MDKTLTAVFDGEVLRPDSPSDLEPNKRCVIVVKEAIDVKDDRDDAWSVLSESVGIVEAPEDWAHEHDHHLYGIPKQ